MAAQANTPLALDTAYMPVPTCASCRYWERDQVGTHAYLDDPGRRAELAKWGDCRGLKQTGTRAHPWGEGYEVEGEGLDTREDFGCVQHEERASAAVATPQTANVSEGTA